MAEIRLLPDRELLNGGSFGLEGGVVSFALMVMLCGDFDEKDGRKVRQADGT